MKFIHTAMAKVVGAGAAALIDAYCFAVPFAPPGSWYVVVVVGITVVSLGVAVVDEVTSAPEKASLEQAIRAPVAS